MAKELPRPSIVNPTERELIAYRMCIIRGLSYREAGELQDPPITKAAIRGRLMRLRSKWPDAFPKKIKQGRKPNNIKYHYKQDGYVKEKF